MALNQLIGLLLVGALLVSVLLSTGVVAHRPPSGGKLCLATESPMTGNDKSWGTAVADAVQLAVQQNQALGHGFTLETIRYGEVPKPQIRRDPQLGAQNVTAMVRTPCILGLVGPASSETAAIEMPITARGGLVMISPANTNPGLTIRLYAPGFGLNFDQLHPPGKPTTYFRTVVNDAFQGLELAAYASRRPPKGLGARSAYIVDDHTAYGGVVAAGFDQEFPATGGTIVGKEDMPIGGGARVAELATRIVAARPDVVCFGGTTAFGAGQLKAQLAQRGYTGLFVSGDGVAQDPTFIEQVGTPGAGNVYAIVPVIDLAQAPSDAAASFLRAFHAQYPGEEPDGYAAYAYDAAMILITAIKHLIQLDQAVTRATVREQVQRIQYAGMTGRVNFDPNGDNAHGIFSVYTVRDGRWVWVKQEDV
jgi:branched-chain amino acid transport system substrate-binding protein